MFDICEVKLINRDVSNRISMIQNGGRRLRLLIAWEIPRRIRDFPVFPYLKERVAYLLYYTSLTLYTSINKKSVILYSRKQHRYIKDPKFWQLWINVSIILNIIISLFVFDNVTRMPFPNCHYLYILYNRQHYPDSYRVDVLYTELSDHAKYRDWHTRYWEISRSCLSLVLYVSDIGNITWTF